jgi:hypothetical protein
MTRIVTTHYRYKRPPRKRKAPRAVGALEVPTVVTAKSSRRPIGKKAAAEMQLAPVSGRMGAVQPSTPREAERVAHPAVTTDRKPAVLIIRRAPAKLLPPGLLAETPEEHQRRGDLADALFREMKRRIAKRR